MNVIVFNQQELDAIPAEVKSVALCDNSFVLPPTPDREYIAIGTVSAAIPCRAIDAVRLGIVFTGFIPEFDNSMPVKEACLDTKVAPSSFCSSFVSSFASSFTSSFFTSFSSMHEYEYEYGTSFSASFAGSMPSSFKKTVIREIAVNGYGLNLI